MKIGIFFCSVLTLIVGGTAIDILATEGMGIGVRFVFQLVLTAAVVHAAVSKDKIYIAVVFCISMLFYFLAAMTFAKEINAAGFTATSLVAAVQIVVLFFMKPAALDDIIRWIWESKMFAPIRLIHWLIVEFSPMLKQARGR